MKYVGSKNRLSKQIAPIKCPNCGLIVDEKYVVDINSTCPICGKELFTELKKMIEK